MRIKTVNLSDRTKSGFFFSSLHPKGVNVYNLVVVAKEPLQMPASIFSANVPGGYFLKRGQRGCAAGWGRIFTTGLTIMGSHFQ